MKNNKGAYRKPMNEQPKIRINWKNIAADSFSAGIKLSLIAAAISFVGFGVTSCVGCSMQDDDRKATAELIKNIDIANDKMKAATAPCQDMVIQVGCNNAGKIACHPDAKMTYLGAVVECRCPKATE